MVLLASVWFQGSGAKIVSPLVGSISPPVGRFLAPPLAPTIMGRQVTRREPWELAEVFLRHTKDNWPLPGMLNSVWYCIMIVVLRKRQGAYCKLHYKGSPDYIPERAYQIHLH